MWGNGAATVRIFARQGAKVFGCDLHLEVAQHAQRQIAAEGGKITVIGADVTNSESVKAAVDAAIATYGRIDILIKYVDINCEE